MNEVWTLWHSENPDPQLDISLIGIYSSLDQIHKVIARLENEPYFQKFPEGFTVDKNKMDSETYFTESKTTNIEPVGSPKPLSPSAPETG